VQLAKSGLVLVRHPAAYKTVDEFFVSCWGDLDSISDGQVMFLMPRDAAAFGAVLQAAETLEKLDRSPYLAR
jgi:hypothetical protein